MRLAPPPHKQACDLLAEVGRVVARFGQCKGHVTHGGRVAVAHGHEHFGEHFADDCRFGIVALNQYLCAAIHDANTRRRFLNPLTDFAVLAKEFDCLVLAI